jgi:hypothetical protein
VPASPAHFHFLIILFRSYLFWPCWWFLMFVFISLMFKLILMVFTFDHKFFGLDFHF